MEEQKTATISSESKWQLCTECIVCGEPVPLTEYESRSLPRKMCDKCKRAVLWARKTMVENEYVHYVDKEASDVC